MTKEERIAKVQEMIDAPSCCADLKEAGKAYLAAVGTDKEAEAQAEVWRSMKPYVDADRWNALMHRYDRQARDAWWWRDACVLYFQQFSKLPLPDGYRPAKFKLEDLMRYRLRMDNYTAADMNKLP